MIAPSKPAARRWRPNILIFGASGTGKTKTWLDLVKLTGAHALCIDTHGGTKAWVKDYPTGWDVVDSSSPQEIEEQIDHYLAKPSGYTMFVVDDLSVVHNELLGMADDEIRPLRKRKDKDIGQFTGILDPGSQAVVKRIAAIAMNKLTHLDMARIVVARSKPKYKANPGGGKLFEVDGVTWSGDKDIEYSFDLVIQLEKFGDRRVGVVTKARGMPNMPATIEEFTAEKLLALLPCGAAGFTDASVAEPLIDAVQANMLREMFTIAAMEPGRQSRALNHFGATSIEDVPAKNYRALTEALRTVIAEKSPQQTQQPQPSTATKASD